MKFKCSKSAACSELVLENRRRSDRHVLLWDSPACYNSVLTYRAPPCHMTKIISIYYSLSKCVPVINMNANAHLFIGKG